jgi:maltose O-acetyltransferase
MQGRPTLTGVEYQRMIAGELYAPGDPELVAARARARSLEFRFNHTPPERADERDRILRELLGTVGESVEIEPTLHCDYGVNIHLGDHFYANANCVLLDVAEIRIGDQVMLAPGVQLLTATHPVDPVERTSGRELGFPITVGNRVWLGGGVIVGPGVTIGDDVVVGSGAVVVKDLPAGVVAVGNPARVVREL